MRNMGYGQIPMISLWAVLDEYAAAASAAAAATSTRGSNGIGGSGGGSNSSSSHSNSSSNSNSNIGSKAGGKKKWRKQLKVAGVPELEELTRAKPMAPMRVQMTLEEKRKKVLQMPPLEIPVVLDKLWDGGWCWVVSSCLSLSLCVLSLIHI